jgi:outer membrane lipoprotein-sorting protein
MLSFTFACVWAAATVFGPSIATAAEDPLAAVFAVMDRAAPKFRDLTAEVRKVAYMAVLKEENVDTGTIAVKVPKAHEYRMLINFAQPDRRQISIMGTKVQIFNPTSNIVQDWDLGKTNRSQIEAFLLLGFGSTSKDLLNAYSVRFGAPETVAGQKTSRIELIPKAKDVAAQFPRFELWISDDTGISVQQKMYQPGGDYVLATYTNMKVNQNLPDTAVRLNLPRGVVHEHPQR